MGAGECGAGAGWDLRGGDRSLPWAPHTWFLVTWKAILGYPKASHFVAYLLSNFRVKTSNKRSQAMK